jgi:hypothetical protein
MPGNMTKAQALDWLRKYGATTRGYRQEVAAAYVGLGVRRFRQEVDGGRLPKGHEHGKRIVWYKDELDGARAAWIDGRAGAPQHNSDPIMADIHAAQVTTLRPAD